MKKETARKIYPEIGAGGFSGRDGTVAFYTRVDALLKQSDTALDLGAGRGAFFYDDDVPFRRRLRLLKERCQKVIGLDISNEVLENPSLDEAHVIGPDLLFPIGDNSVDLIISDWTFEHVSNPSAFVSEVSRVLKPGGWICARTPNLYGYISVANRIVPQRLHKSVLRVAQPDRKDKDVFPTVYRLNTKRDLRRVFAEENWHLIAFHWESEPAYMGNSFYLNKAADLMLKWLPESLWSTIFVFAQKLP